MAPSCPNRYLPRPISGYTPGCLACLARLRSTAGLYPQVPTVLADSRKDQITTLVQVVCPLGVWPHLTGTSSRAAHSKAYPRAPQESRTLFHEDDDLSCQSNTSQIGNIDCVNGPAPIAHPWRTRSGLSTERCKREMQSPKRCSMPIVKGGILVCTIFKLVDSGTAPRAPSLRGGRK
jgi:hypothetical protein